MDTLYYSKYHDPNTWKSRLLIPRLVGLVSQKLQDTQLPEVEYFIHNVLIRLQSLWTDKDQLSARWLESSISRAKARMKILLYKDPRSIFSVLHLWSASRTRRVLQCRSRKKKSKQKASSLLSTTQSNLASSQMEINDFVQAYHTGLDHQSYQFLYLWITLDSDGQWKRWSTHLN